MAGIWIGTLVALVGFYNFKTIHQLKSEVQITYLLTISAISISCIAVDGVLAMYPVEYED